MATRKRLPSSKRSAPISRFKKFGFTNSKNKFKKAIKHGDYIVERRPLTSFLTVLLLIFIFIVIGSFLRKPKLEKEISTPEKEVSIYSIGSTAWIIEQDKINKQALADIPCIEEYLAGLVGLGIVQGMLSQETA